MNTITYKKVAMKEVNCLRKKYPKLNKEEISILCCVMADTATYYIA